MSHINAESDDDDTRHPNPSGPTLPYKLLAKFAEHGFDGQRMKESGLALLSLSGIARIIR